MFRVAFQLSRLLNIAYRIASFVTVKYIIRQLFDLAILNGSLFIKLDQIENFSTLARLVSPSFPDRCVAKFPPWVFATPLRPIYFHERLLHNDRSPGDPWTSSSSTVGASSRPNHLLLKIHASQEARSIRAMRGRSQPMMAHLFTTACTYRVFSYILDIDH